MSLPPHSPPHIYTHTHHTQEGMRTPSLLVAKQTAEEVYFLVYFVQLFCTLNMVLGNCFQYQYILIQSIELLLALFLYILCCWLIFCCNFCTQNLLRVLEGWVGFLTYRIMQLTGVKLVYVSILMFFLFLYIYTIFLFTYYRYSC